MPTALAGTGALAAALAAALLTTGLLPGPGGPAPASAQEAPGDTAHAHRHGDDPGAHDAARRGGGADVERIRGLGYIGLMATGAHHRRHHWMIATGREPHEG